VAKQVNRLRVVHVVAAAVALGCSSTGASQSKLVWVRDDGTPATRAEPFAARDACFETVDARKINSEWRFGHLEYAGQVIDCSKAKGYHLVDAPEE
jgi:hypothetical protein